MYACIGACVYVCICIYMFVCVYVCIYIYIRARVGVHTRVGAFCLFVLSNLSTTCVRITGVS